MLICSAKFKASIFIRNIHVTKVTVKLRQGNPNRRKGNSDRELERKGERERERDGWTTYRRGAALHSATGKTGGSTGRFTCEKVQREKGECRDGETMA